MVVVPRTVTTQQVATIAHVTLGSEYTLASNSHGCNGELDNAKLLHCTLCCLIFAL